MALIDVAVVVVEDADADDGDIAAPPGMLVEPVRLETDFTVLPLSCDRLRIFIRLFG